MIHARGYHFKDASRGWVLSVGQETIYIHTYIYPQLVRSHSDLAIEAPFRTISLAARSFAPQRAKL